MMYMTYRHFPFCFQIFHLRLHQGKYARRKYSQWKVSVSHGEGVREQYGNLTAGNTAPAFQQRTGCLSRHDSSVVPSIRFVRPVPKYLLGIWFTLNSNWMQNKIKTTPLNWAWPGIIRADQSHYSSKVKSSPARSVRSHRRDCHSRKALRLEADNHLGRLSG